MDLATTPPTRLQPLAGPQTSTWLWLSLAVMLAHGAMLLEWGPGLIPGSQAGGDIPDAPAPGEQGASANPALDGRPTPARVPSVTSNDFRWLVLAPPPPPPPPAPPPPPKPKPKPRPAPIPSPVPAPDAAPAQTAPAPETLVADDAQPDIDNVEDAFGNATATEPTKSAWTQPTATPVVETPLQTDDAVDKAAPPDEPASTLGPATPPGNARLRYSVLAKSKGLDYRASGEMTWQVDGQTYRAEMEVGAFLLGSRKQVSQGVVSPEGLVPQRFDDISRRERRTEFDRSTGQVRYQRNGQQETLRAGNQDQLSVAIQLAALAKAQPDLFRAGGVINLPVSDTRRTSVWQFDVLPRERIRTGAGEFDVIRLHRRSTDSKDKSVTIELAPALDHMPVRIRLDETNGDFLEQTLDSFD